MDVERTISSIVVLIIRNHLFYGHILCQLPRIYTTSIPTMAVGRAKGGCSISLFINPEYVESIFKEHGREKATNHVHQVLLHEIMHVIFRHLYIDKPDKNKLAIACELSVNSYIDRTKLVEMGTFPEDFKLKPKLSVEEYYNLLKFPESKKIKITIGGGGGSGKNDNSDGSSGKETGDDKNTITIYLQDSHDKWEEIKDDKISQILVSDIVRKAKELTERKGQWGNIPGEIREAVGDMLETREQMISWETALRDFIASSSETLLDYTNKRYSKRYGTRPGTKKEDVLDLAIGIDTSGSISNDDLEVFFSELYWISRQNVKITVFECDTEIGREYPFEDWDPNLPLYGGGGTDLEPVIKEASARKFDALIYFTDAYAPQVREEYRIPTLLVVKDGGSQRRKSEMPCKCNIVFHVGEDGSVTVE